MAQPTGQPESLAVAAKGAIAWSASFTILRDLVQFAAMVILVRLLSPHDYGRFVIAQSIYWLISGLSAKNFVAHAMQVRDPSAINWRQHLTASVFFNLFALVLTLAAAGLLLLTEDFASAAGPLAVLSLFHLIDIPGGFVAVRLKVAHDWRRSGALETSGAMLGLAAAVVLAALGAGVWALTATILLTSVPLATHFFLRDRWRPQWPIDWAGYRDVFRYGLSRIGQNGLLAGRYTAEQTMLGATYNLATVGIFSRSVGLATALSGRFGTAVAVALYPVVTRAEAGSERYRRLANLIIKSVAWLTLPTAAFLMLAAQDVVALLFGPKWAMVANLLPFAAAHLALTSLFNAAYMLVLANDRPGTSLMLDIASALSAFVLIFWLIPQGPGIYLAAMAVHSAVMLGATIIVLRSTGGIALRSFLTGLLPAVIGAALASAAALLAGAQLADASTVFLRLGVQAAAFGCVYLLSLRLLFPAQLRELLEVAPLGGRFAGLLRL